MTEVKRFADEPTAGRPRLLEFSGPEGRLAFHVERDTGSLWIFAQGPRGGDRGTLAIGTQRADELLDWLGNSTRAFSGVEYHMRWLPDHNRLIVDRVGWSMSRPAWSIHLDFEALAMFGTFLREWAVHAERQEAHR